MLKQMDLQSEQKPAQGFLRGVQQELHQKSPMLEPKEEAIDKEFQKILSLKKIVESRLRALEVLEQKRGNKQGNQSNDLLALKKAVTSEFSLQMVSYIVLICWQLYNVMISGILITLYLIRYFITLINV